MPALRKLHPLFACEITGFDLTEKKFIEEAMDRCAVAVLRDQHISDEAHIAFSRRFGELEKSPHFGVGKDGRVRMRHPELFDVSNLDEDGSILAEDDRRRAFRLANEMWHTDSSFVPGRGALLAAARDGRALARRRHGIRRHAGCLRFFAFKNQTTH